MKLQKDLSDKIYWHKYINFYEKHLPQKLDNILEIGVLKGDSIRFWREKYDSATIYGLDIIETKDTWPIDDKIIYFKIDQSDAFAYRKLLKDINKKLDLIVDDGSHDPLHQKISLMESISSLNSNSIYILEDIHTSHEDHPLYKQRLKKFNADNKFFNSKKDRILMPLQCLLLIEHFKSNNLPIESIKKKIDFKSSLFSFDEIVKIFVKVKSIYFYKRTVLPDYCYDCKTNDFDFINLKCSCGTDLYSQSDSMTAILEF